MATILALATPAPRRFWFMYQLGRETSRSGFRSLPARFDAIRYAPAAQNPKRALLPRLKAMIARAPDYRLRALALILSSQTEEAIKLLEQVGDKDNEAWNVLAVAHMQHALSKDDAGELVTALACADRAISIRDTSAEAVFNRALILEMIGLRRLAARGYWRTLALDPSSAWAAETRQRFHDNARISGVDWSSARTRLNHVAGDNDQRIVDAIVRTFPQQARTFGEGVALADWADRVQAGSPSQGQPLSLARAIGSSLRRINGEEFLSDAVAAVDRAIARRDDQAIHTLARGHITYRKARILYGNEQRRIAEALPLFAEARDLFQRGGSPMALLADYYHASALFEQNAGEEALNKVRAISAPPQYKALNALIDWFTGTATGSSGHYYESYQSYRSALDLFQSLSEEQNAMRMRTEIAFILSFLGRSPEAWRMRRTIFRRASETGDNLLIEKTISTAAFDALQQKHWSEAASLYRLVTETSDPGTERLRIDALLWGTYAETCAGVRDRSIDRLREAKQEIAHLHDREMADSALQDANLIEGLVLATRVPRAALRPLSQFIDYSDRHGKTFSIPEALLERARAARAIGNTKLASGDLTRAVAIIETRRQQVATVALRDTFAGTATEIYEELIDLQESTGDITGAFATLERARARAILDRISSGLAMPIPLADLEHQMEPRQTLVAYVSLPHRLLIFVLQREEFHCLSLPVRREQLESATSDLLVSIHADKPSEVFARSAELYRWLIAPLGPYMNRINTLVMVPDDTLSSIPFAALSSEKSGYLISRFQVLTAPSASVFNRTERRTPLPRQTIVAVGNPAFDHTAFPALENLPQAGAEASMIIHGYRTGQVLTGSAATIERFFAEAKKAEVLHLATHALINSGDPWMSALVMTPSGNDSGLLYLNRIAAASFQDLDTVVLAGCRTGVSASGSGSVRSLATAFLTGGARTVIGTLWDVDDATTSAFSRRFHEELRSGATPALALRRTQLALSSSRDPELQKPRTWAAFELLGSAR